MLLLASSGMLTVCKCANQDAGQLPPHLPEGGRARTAIWVEWSGFPGEKAERGTVTLSDGA